MAEYINRDLHELLIRMAGWFPVVSLTGPRQSGKSTLVRHAFPDYSYVTLEDPQTRRAALEDPVSFIRNRKGGLIIDEAQYAPDLFSIDPGCFGMSGEMPVNTSLRDRKTFFDDEKHRPVSCRASRDLKIAAIFVSRSGEGPAGAVGSGFVCARRGIPSPAFRRNAVLGLFPQLY